MSGKQIDPNAGSNKYVNIAFELIMKVGILFLVIFLCFKLLKPFMGMMIW